MSQLQKEKTGYKYIIKNLDGGLNTATFDFDIAENEAADLVNFWFNKKGVLEKRPGYVKYNKTEIEDYKFLVL